MIISKINNKQIKSERSGLCVKGTLVEVVKGLGVGLVVIRLLTFITIREITKTGKEK